MKYIKIDKDPETGEKSAVAMDIDLFSIDAAETDADTDMDTEADNIKPKIDFSGLIDSVLRFQPGEREPNKPEPTDELPF